MHSNYQVEDMDFMDLSDNLLVEYAEAVEKSITTLPAHPRAAPNFNFKNCTVNIHYHGQNP